LGMGRTFFGMAWNLASGPILFAPARLRREK
jgi:hypothetical protein